MDPLSDIISLLRPSAAVAKPITGKGEWAISHASYDAPGFTIVLRGECWVTLGAEKPLHLRAGDFLLVPTVPASTLSSRPGMEGELRDLMTNVVRHGDQEGEADFTALGGAFSIEQVNAPLLIALLPSRIHIPASEGRSGRLHRLIELITEECWSDEPGKEILLQRLLEILLVETLRWRGFDDNSNRAGLLRAMRDPTLAKVLTAMHADIRGDWTVAGLAKIAGMSRSAFAARFGEVLGCGAIEYLGRWRMALAKNSLLQGAKTLDRIADEIGYASASAFSTAFRKRLGYSPGQFARLAADNIKVSSE